MAIEKLSVILELVSGNYKKEAKEAADATSRIGGAAQKATTGGLNLMRGAIVGLVGAKLLSWARDSVDALARIERIGAQTDAALRSTGGAANVTREEIDGLATSLENLTSVEAESITEGQNLLLTFTNIRNEAGAGNDVFDQTTKAMVDLSVAMGTDIPGAAVLLGKAINAPLTGLTSLTRAGVQFTDEQKTLIRGFVESNDVMSAQKIILEELNVQFGGSAEALGSTLTGRIDRFNDALGDLGETAVGSAIPALEDLVIQGTRLADQLGPMSAAAATAKAALASLAADGIDVLAQKTPAAVTALQQAVQGMGFLNAPLERMDEILGVINETLEFSAGEWGDFRRAVAEGKVDLGLTAEEIEKLLVLLQAEEVALSTISRSGHARGIDEITDAQFRLGEETSKTTDEIKAQQDEIRAAIDPLFALRKAADENREAQIKYAEAVRLFGPASVQAKEAGLELVSTQADLNYYAELYSANFGPAQEEAFRQVARQAGLTNEEIDRIIQSTDALNNKQVDIYITTHQAVQTEAVEDIFAGGKAAGGPVMAGRQYLVGERGPEMFIPQTSGSIVSNSQLTNSGNSRSQTFYFAAPVKPVDLQWISLQNNLETLVS